MSFKSLWILSILLLVMPAAAQAKRVFMPPVRAEVSGPCKHQAVESLIMARQSALIACSRGQSSFGEFQLRWNAQGKAKRRGSGGDWSAAATRCAWHVLEKIQVAKQACEASVAIRPAPPARLPIRVPDAGSEGGRPE